MTAAPLAAYRARRIQNLLQAKPKLTVEDFRRIQADAYSISGATFARSFVTAMRTAAGTLIGSEAQTREAVRLLESWDGTVVPDSRAALLVAHMRAAFRRRVLAAALGPERARQYNYSNADTFVDQVVTEPERMRLSEEQRWRANAARVHAESVRGEQESAWLPAEFRNYAELFRACLADARAELTKDYGADETKWTWGREAVVRFPHPLAGVPLLGAPFAIQPFPQTGAVGGLPTVNRGANVSMRLIADVSDWDNTRQGVALGVSGDPSSPHWKDQLPDWQNVTTRPLPFTAAAIARAAVASSTLEPEGK